jgi:hypothetical protein
MQVEYWRKLHKQKIENTRKWYQYKPTYADCGFSLYGYIITLTMTSKPTTPHEIHGYIVYIYQVQMYFNGGHESSCVLFAETWMEQAYWFLGIWVPRKYFSFTFTSLAFPILTK